MTLQVIGALCIVVALIGGGFRVSNVEIPKLSGTRIIALLLAGLVFVVVGLLVNANSAMGLSPGPSPRVQTTASSKP